MQSAVPILPSRDVGETLAFLFFRTDDVEPLASDFSCYLRVEDADRLYGEWNAIGVATDPATGSRLIAPWDTDYGMREFALVDPSGNLYRVDSPFDR